MRWPRGLTLIGMLSLLVAAWGGIVPFVGPTFNFSANGSPSWHWTNMHAWLYVLPGAVGVVASLLILSRPRTGRAGTRFTLALLGLVVVACGAWFVLGPTVWPILEPGTVFRTGQSAMDHFTTVVGYNYGVGIVLVALGAMVVDAGIAEREVAVNLADPRIPAYEPDPEPDLAGPTMTTAPAAGKLSRKERRRARKEEKRAAKAPAATTSAAAAPTQAGDATVPGAPADSADPS